MDKRDQTLREKSKKSTLCQFWYEYMVEILLCFIRAEKNWWLGTPQIIYCLHFYHQNYSRHATVYLAHMEALPEVAPEVHEQFNEGNSVVARSEIRFAQVSVDLALEQTINKDTKSRGGIIGFSRNHGARPWWVRCEKADGRVNEQRQPISWDRGPLVNTKSGQVAPEEVASDLSGALEAGKKALMDFVDSCLNKGQRFHALTKRHKLKTFCILKMKTKLLQESPAKLTETFSRKSWWLIKQENLTCPSCSRTSWPMSLSH